MLVTGYKTMFTLTWFAVQHCRKSIETHDSKMGMNDDTWLMVIEDAVVIEIKIDYQEVSLKSLSWSMMKNRSVEDVFPYSKSVTMRTHLTELRFLN